MDLVSVERVAAGNGVARWGWYCCFPIALVQLAAEASYREGFSLRLIAEASDASVKSAAITDSSNMLESLDSEMALHNAAGVKPNARYR